MGCDIHLYFERKVNGVWEEIKFDEKLMPDDRYYDLFYLLAGVRPRMPTDVTPWFADRGIPDDTSLPKGDDFYIGDHSFTHAYLDEILNAPWISFDMQDCYFHVFCRDVLFRICNNYIQMSNLEQRDIRVLMGFDN